MKCTNCSREMPEGQKICLYCEKPIEPPPSEEELDIAEALLGQMTDEQKADLLKRIRESDTADEFVNSIFVGPCPVCGNEKPGTSEHERGIEDETVGRCAQCNTHWCTECGTIFKPAQTECAHWSVCQRCPSQDTCEEITEECPTIQQWQATPS